MARTLHGLAGSSNDAHIRRQLQLPWRPEEPNPMGEYFFQKNGEPESLEKSSAQQDAQDEMGVGAEALSGEHGG